MKGFFWAFLSVAFFAVAWSGLELWGAWALRRGYVNEWEVMTTLGGFLLLWVFWNFRKGLGW